MAKTKVLRAIPDLCTGCRICELVCSLYKTGTANPSLARIKIQNVRKESRFIPVICRHCQNAPCFAACPVPGAMSLNEAIGVVSINADKCITCLACMEACPFGAIQIGPNAEVLKCDLCGGEPLCAKYCPVRPDHQSHYLSYPRASCLEYVEPDKVTRKAGKEGGE